MTYLIGNKIRLRASEPSDIPLFLKWINDPEVTENLMQHFPVSSVEEEHWYNKMIEKPAAEHVFVIEINKEDPEIWQPIGNIQFLDINWRVRKTEVGIMIGEKQFWDQGYGTEAIRVMLKHGFETLNLHRIWLQVYEKNYRGIRSYQKVGFVQEGRFRDGHYQHGVYSDILVMSILRPEWEEKYNQ